MSSIVSPTRSSHWRHGNTMPACDAQCPHKREDGRARPWFVSLSKKNNNFSHTHANHMTEKIDTKNWKDGGEDSWDLLSQIRSSQTRKCSCVTGTRTRTAPTGSSHSSLREPSLRLTITVCVVHIFLNSYRVSLFLAYSFASSQSATHFPFPTNSPGSPTIRTVSYQNQLTCATHRFSEQLRNEKCNLRKNRFICQANLHLWPCYSKYCNVISPNWPNLSGSVRIFCHSCSLFSENW